MHLVLESVEGCHMVSDDEKISLWIIEDNDGFRNTVTHALNGTGKINCKASFNNCEDALRCLKQAEQPQVLLLDIELPGISGVEASKLIKAQAPEIQIIMLTIFDDHTHIMQALCGGAAGYILKTASIEAITSAIEEVTNGGAPMSPPIARSVLNLFKRFTPPPAANYDLTARENEVLQLLVDGLANKEIAGRLSLSPFTVDKHIRGIYAKLQVHSRSAAVAKAVQEKLF